MLEVLTILDGGGGGGAQQVSTLKRVNKLLPYLEDGGGGVDKVSDQ